MANLDPQYLKERGEQLTAISKERSKAIERSKELAKQRRETGRNFRQTDLLNYLELCSEYTEECYSKHEPLTHAGFILKCGVNTSSWQRWGNGEHDHLLYDTLDSYNIPYSVIDDGEIYEHTTPDGETIEIPLITYSTLVEKCRLAIQQQLERNCYTNKGNPAGSIFGLKARFGWQDSPQTVGTINQTLVIADKEQAVKALEMLK